MRASGHADWAVIVPAFNEERQLPTTLAALDGAGQRLRRERGTACQVVVVDNASTDGTARVARELGATVAREPKPGIARARNRGARCTPARALVFVDADVTVPDGVLVRIDDELADPSCLGGGVAVEHRPRRRTVAMYLAAYERYGNALRMVQGGCQFCRREPFEALGGYDSGLHMGEDVEFVWRLRRLARQRGDRIAHIEDERVLASSRRWDTWPLWRTLLWTNPLTATALARWARPWVGYHRHAPR